MKHQTGFVSRIATNFIGMMRDKNTPSRDKLLMLLGFVYLISPIDLIPEGLLAFLGYTDDLAVLVGTFTLIRKHYKRYVERQNTEIIDVTDHEWKD